MAHLTCNFFSKSLMRTVDITVILPTDKYVASDPHYQPPKTFKTLYLLHGIFGSTTDWIIGTRIAAWAAEKNLAVVMPSGENKFYVDRPDSLEYFGEFIGKELVDFTRRTFPLSTKREDTFIGGLSMGGYGALRNGLKYHETFGSIVALSSALLIDDILVSTYDHPNLLGNRHYYESIFGDLSKLKGSDMDYYALIDGLKKEDIPHIYMACGDDDKLRKQNDSFHQYLTKKGIPHEYQTGPGGHDWVFWDTFISKALAWLPLDEASQGVSSGHVH